jgi:hypothetical protein
MKTISRFTPPVAAVCDRRRRSQSAATARLLCALCALLFIPLSAPAADARVITENGTNILAIGIDASDFEIVRIYFKGTNQFEIRADQILSKDRTILPPPPPPLIAAERAALLSALSARTNVTVLDSPTILSNLVRLRLLDDNLARTR